MKTFLDKDHEKQLETIISKLNLAKTLDEAKDLARQYIKEMKFQKKAEKLLRDLEKATNVARVQKLIIDIHLSGEGNGVVKF